MRRLLAVAAAGLALTGCGVRAEHSARKIDPNRLPVALQVDHGSTTTIGTALAPVELWFVDDDRLVAVEHQAEAPITATSAVAELTAGPSDADGASLRSAIPDPQVILQTTVDDGTATVELADEFNQVPDQVLAIGQLVLTLTGLDDVDQVRFRLGEADVAVPLPDGTTTDQPVTAADFAELRR